jgi:guanine deaminase
MSARGYRASLLWFPDPALPVAQWEEDGLLVVAPDAQGREVVQAIGDWRTLSALNCRLPVEHLPGRIIAPGFVDMHVHFPQINVIGSPADGLLPWLENYTFPEEQRFADTAYCA